MGEWYPSWDYHVQNYSPLPMQGEDFTQQITYTNGLTGSALRILLSNLYGTEPLQIVWMHVEAGGEKAAVTLYGQSVLVLKAGETVYSDVISLPVRAGAQVTITCYVREAVTICGYVGLNSDRVLQSRFFRGAGTENPISQAELSRAAEKGFNRQFYLGIRSIQVYRKEKAPVITVFGDSLVHQGYWMNALFARLLEARQEVTVTNEGISGNRVLFDGHSVSRLNPLFGEAGIRRMERDVFGRFTPDAVILAEGINELVHPGNGSPMEELVTHTQLIEGLKALIAGCRKYGRRVYMATLTPFYNYDCIWSPQREMVRQHVNNWIRSTEELDGVLDLDRMVRDPVRPERLLGALDSGDGLHFNEAAGERIAEETWNTFISVFRKENIRQ